MSSIPSLLTLHVYFQASITSLEPELHFLPSCKGHASFMQEARRAKRQ